MTLALVGALYFGCALSGDFRVAAGTPAWSGLPILIHSMVPETGREPTCKYTPVNGGSKNGTPAMMLSASFKKPYLLTGQSPIPSPALVKAFASASVALAHANHGWLGASVVQAFPVGYETLTPSDIRAEGTCERFSSMNCGRHPNCARTIAISFARFCASGSGANSIAITVPAKASIPANHSAACGGLSIPINPTWRGSLRSAARYFRPLHARYHYPTPRSARWPQTFPFLLRRSAIQAPKCAIPIGFLGYWWSSIATRETLSLRRPRPLSQPRPPTIPSKQSDTNTLPIRVGPGREGLIPKPFGFQMPLRS
jgi:hypothetical protein